MPPSFGFLSGSGTIAQEGTEEQDYGGSPAWPLQRVASRLTDEAQACSRKTAVTECLLILQDGPGPTRRDPVKFGLFYQLPCAEPQSEVTRYQETIEQIIHADALG